MADAVLWRSAVRSVKCIYAHGMRCIPAHEDLGFSFGEHLEYYGYFIVTQCSYILKSERPPRPRGSFAAQKQKAEDATGTKMAFSNLNKNCRKC